MAHHRSKSLTTKKDRSSKKKITYDEDIDTTIHPSISIVLNVRVYSSHVMMIVDTKRDQIRRRVVWDDVGLRKIGAKERKCGTKTHGEREREIG